MELILPLPVDGLMGWWEQVLYRGQPAYLCLWSNSLHQTKSTSTTRSSQLTQLLLCFHGERVVFTALVWEILCDCSIGAHECGAQRSHRDLHRPPTLTHIQRVIEHLKRYCSTFSTLKAAIRHNLLQGLLTAFHKGITLSAQSFSSTEMLRRC